MPPSPDPSQFNTDDSRVIRSKIASLVRRRSVRSGESDDVEQYINLHVWERLPLYDASRGTRHGYVVRLINNALSNYLRNQRASKRASRRMDSLDRRVRSPAGDVIPLGETISQREHDARRGTRPMPEEQALWDLYIEAVMSRLPDSHQAVLRRWLQSMTIAEIAQDLGIHRSTVYRRLEELRDLDPRKG